MEARRRAEDVSTSIDVPPGTTAAALEGCGYCGPYCPRCTSTPAAPQTQRPNRHDRRRAAAGDYCYCDGPEIADDMRGIARPPDDAFFTDEEMRGDGRVFGPHRVRYEHEVGPRHVELYRGRRVRDVGAEWVLMCRRVRGVIDGVRRSVEYNALTGFPLFRRNATAGGRKTQLARAIVAGGWMPGPDDPLGPAVAALTLRISHWFRRRRRRH